MDNKKLKKAGTDSWLDPNGNIIEVGQFNHNEYASELLKKEMGIKRLYDFMEKNYISYPYSILHKRGWIRIIYRNNPLQKIEIIGDCIDLTKPMRNTIDPAMNESQLRVAKILCEECNTLFHIAINDKRFW
jgi:hypothetical protein